jgi:hypothetical protein
MRRVFCSPSHSPQPRRTSWPKRGLPVSLLLLGVLATGCGKANQSSSDDPAVSLAPSSSAAPDSSTPVVSPSSPVPVSSPVLPPSIPPSTTSPVTSTSPAGPVDGPGGCPTSSLKVMVLRASGAAGHQYAFLQFTNIGSKSCSLTGFPGVQLLKAGRPLGQPAARSALAATRVQIAPGAALTARLVDDSTCNADNADSVQIIPPNRTDKIVLPSALRGCPLHIDPVMPS